jgi:hypothetical protein
VIPIPAQIVDDLSATFIERPTADKALGEGVAESELFAKLWLNDARH